MKSLNAKIILSVLIPTLLIFSTMGVLSYIEHMRQFEIEIELKAKAVLSLLRIVSIPSYENFEYATLDEVAEGEVLNDPDIAFVVFLDENGAPLTKSPDNVSESPTLIIFKEEIRSLDEARRLLGFLRVGVDTTALRQGMMSDIWTLLISFFAATVMLTILVVLLTRRLLEELKNANIRANELATKAEAVSKGLSRANAEEQALSHILQLSLHPSPIQEYLQEALELMIGSVPWLALLPMGGVFLKDRESAEQRLLLIAKYNLAPALHTLCAQIPFGYCLCGRAAQEKEVQYAACIDDRHDTRFDGMKPHGHYNVPILSSEVDVLGVIVFYLPHGHEREEGEINYLKRMAEVFSMGISLRYTTEAMQVEITERKQVEHSLRKKSTELAGRVKEINCLFSMAQLIETPDLDEYELCRRGVKIIPQGWKHYEITCARITIDGNSFTSNGFEKTPWRQVAEIQIGDLKRGEIEVFYLEQRPELDEGPFLKEERELLDHISMQLSDALKKIAAERTIRDSEEQNRILLESTTDGIFTVDTEGICTICNQSAARMLGYEIPEVVGENAHTLFHHSRPDGSDHPWEECFLNKVLQGEAVVKEEVFWRSDGSPLTVECRAAPIIQNGETVGSVVSFSDMTERHTTELQLRQAQKLESIGQLAAGIAHEINTPTQFVNDNTRFLQEAIEDYQRLLVAYEQLLQAPAEDKVREERIKEIEDLVEEIDLAYLQEEIPQAIDQSLEGLERIAKIVRSMKEFSHPGMDEKTPIDINQAIETTINVSRNEWKYHADIETDLDPGLPNVSCLPGEINQVLLNLIVNAAHAIANVVGESGDKGLIRISTRLDGAWAEIRVSDTGTGIPEEIKQRIFDPFFTTKMVGKGTGQGLAIAYSVVVDKHGGVIDLESEEGKGTTFIISLPLEGCSDSKN